MSYNMKLDGGSISGKYYDTFYHLSNAKRRSKHFKLITCHFIILINNDSRRNLQMRPVL